MTNKIQMPELCEKIDFWKILLKSFLNFLSKYIEIDFYKYYNGDVKDKRYGGCILW